MDIYGRYSTGHTKGRAKEVKTNNSTNHVGTYVHVGKLYLLSMARATQKNRICPLAQKLPFF